MKKLLLILVLGTGLLFATVGQVEGAASLSLTKAFAASSIYYRDSTTLTLTLTNNGTVPLTNVQLTDILPSGIIAAGPNPGSTCNGSTTFSGNAGPPFTQGTTQINHTGTSLQPAQSCVINVQVTGRDAGLWTNTNVTIGSTETGSSTSPASAQVQVNLQPVQVFKSFSSTVLNVGQVTTMTITLVDPNHIEGWHGPVSAASVVDNLPAGLVVADVPKVDIAPDAACNSGAITGATAGSASINYSPSLFEFGRCKFTVDLKVTQAGTITNTTSAPTGGSAPGTPASATLTVFAPNSPCINPNLLSNPSTSSLLVNSQMGFSSSANCPSTPVYKWWVGKVVNGVPNWVPQTLYSTNTNFYWTPTETGTFYIAFWVQNQGGSPDTSDTYAQVVRTVVAPTPCTNATLTSNPSGANLVIGNSMTFTAGATCGGTPSYRWYIGEVINGVPNWRLGADYAPNANVFTWTPTSLGTFYVAFWVQNAGGSPTTNDQWLQLVKNVVSPAPCTSVDLISNPPGGSAGVNTTVVFTAAAQCSGPADYRWWVAQVVNGTPNWTPATAYGAANTFSWTPTVGGNYQVAVWAQNRGGSPWTFDAINQVAKTVNAPAPCASTGLTSNPPSSNVTLNTSVTFSASANCASPQFRWWVAKIVNGTPQWTPATAYGPSNLFTWTPTSPGTYLIAFWVQRQGGGDWTYDAVDQVQRVVAAAAPCTAVSLTSTPSSPSISVNTSEVFSASSTCVNAPQLRFWVARIVNGVPQWVPVGPYSGATTFTWTPTIAGTYYIAVWVQNAGGNEWTMDAADQVTRTVS